MKIPSELQAESILIRLCRIKDRETGMQIASRLCRYSAVTRETYDSMFRQVVKRVHCGFVLGTGRSLFVCRRFRGKQVSGLHGAAGHTHLKNCRGE